MEEEAQALPNLGRAYWNLGAPLSYAQAAGAVVIHWGRFEMQFMGFIRFLSRRPDLAASCSKTPRSFEAKAKLFRALSRDVFSKCPQLAERLCDYSTRANQTCKMRNAIVHGSWLDCRLLDPELGVTLTTEPDGSGDFYSVTLEQLEALSLKIQSLHCEGLAILFVPAAGAPSERLTSSEVSAVLEYVKNYPSPDDCIPPRHPSRKGSPQRPEPFQV